MLGILTFLSEQSSKRCSTDSTVVRTWSIRRNAQWASLTEKLKHKLAQARGCKWYKPIIKIYECDNRRNRKSWSNKIWWHSPMYTNPQYWWKSQATGNQKYTCTHTKTMYDVYAHSSMSTLAILVLGLLKKKKMNKFAWAVNSFWISGTSQAHFCSFKGFYQHGHYCKGYIDNQTRPKTQDSEEKPTFSLKLPLSRHIARLAMFSIDSGILVNLYASARHPHTPVATGEWMIFWPSEDSSIEVRSNECSRHLEIRSIPTCTCKVATSNQTIKFCN